MTPFKLFFDEIREDPAYWASRLLLLTFGALIGGAAVSLFFDPSDIAPGGLAGLSLIGNRLLGLPIGMTILALNIPILILGSRRLTGWRTFVSTVYVVVIYSFAVDGVGLLFGSAGITDDVLLNALFGGIMAGIGDGLVFRAGGTSGGTSTLARLLQDRFGIPLSSSSLYTDFLVLILVGVILSWEQALYSTIGIFTLRLASDYILEGVSKTNTALVITRSPEPVIRAVARTLRRGMTRLEGQGTYQKLPQTVLIVTVARTEVNALRKLLQIVDPNAFVTVLKGRVTYGGGFGSLAPHLPLKFDEQDDTFTVTTVTRKGVDDALRDEDA